MSRDKRKSTLKLTRNGHETSRKPRAMNDAPHGQKTCTGKNRLKSGAGAPKSVWQPCAAEIRPKMY